MTRGEVELEFFQKAGGLDEHIVMMMADEIIRLRDALATVSGERDALVSLVEALRQYYQMEVTDDELYAAFCAWRENPFTNPTPSHA